MKVLTWGFLLVSVSSSIRRAIVWMPSAWVVMYGSKIPLRSGKCELWEHDRPTVGLGESSCGCSHTYMFDHVSMRVLNCGYLWRVAVILEYMHQGMYVWEYLVYCLLLYFLGNYWAEMKSSAGTLTTYRCRSTSYRIWENVCMPPYISLAFKFF